MDHHTGKVLAYVFGRRKDNVFLRLQQLLEPFGITKFYTDGWGAYERHIEAEKYHVGKENTQKIESKHINLGTGSVCCRSIRDLHLSSFLDQEYLLEGEALLQHS